MKDLWGKISAVVFALFVGFKILNPELDLNAKGWGILIGLIAESGLDFLLFLIKQQVDNLAAAFTALNTAIDAVIGAPALLKKSLEDLNKISWANFKQGLIDAGLMGKSPTKLETGVRGIIGVMGELTPVLAGFFGFQKMKEDLTLLVMETIPLFVNSTVLEFLRLKTEILLHVDELVRRMIQRFIEMKNKVVGIFRSMFAAILAIMNRFLEAAAEVLEEIAVMFEEWAERTGKAMQGIIDFFNEIIDKVKELIEALEDLYEMQKKTGQVPGSPSGWEIALTGVGKAMHRLATVDLPRLSAAMAPLPAYAPAPAAGAVTTTTTTHVTVPIGPVYIGNGMDMADFQLRVEQSVARAVYGRP